MTKVQSLWNLLLDRLDDAGLLTFRVATETPAEIGKEILRKTGDDRVLRFVWHYYYPKIFGSESGVMTDREASELIESFRNPPKVDPVQFAVQDGKLRRDTPLCPFCGTNPVEAGGRAR